MDGGPLVHVDLKRLFDRFSLDLMAEKFSKKIRDGQVLRPDYRHLDVGTMAETLVAPRMQGKRRLPALGQSDAPCS